MLEERLFFANVVHDNSSNLTVELLISIDLIAYCAKKAVAIRLDLLNGEPCFFQRIFK